MYADFFGLKRNPFELSPDPAFMCHSEKSREALASIMYAVEERKGFVVITGEVGTGKTLIVRSLFKLWKSKGIAFANIVAPRLSVIDFLRYATSDLGIKVTESTKGNLLQALYGFIVSEFQKGLTTVLVIDEAHQIPTAVLEEIRMLTNIETDQQKLVQVLLVGQPELDRKLDSFELRQLKQRIAVRCQLEPLRQEETRQYIERRLELAGADSQATTIFPADTLRAIYRYSQGIPRLVNSICDQALIAAYARQVRVVPVEVIVEVASHFRLDPARNLQQPFASQMESSTPDKSWQSVPTLNLPAVKATDPDPISRHLKAGSGTPVQTAPTSKPETLHQTILRDDSTPYKSELNQKITDPDKIGDVSTDFDLASLNEEAKAIWLPSDPSAVSGALASISTTSEARPAESIQDSTVAPEPIFLKRTATQLTACEPAIGQAVASAADLRAICQSAPILRNTWLYQIPRWLEPWLRLSLVIGAAAVVALALATGVLMARLGKGAVTGPHQVASTRDTFPVKETAASTQLPRTDSGTSKSTSQLGRLAPRAKIRKGTSPRPVLKSRHLSTLSEPPLGTMIQTNELLSDNGLLNSSVPSPGPPEVSSGGHLQPPKLVSSPPPVYPALARLAKVQGVVVIDALVDATGKVTDIKVISGGTLLRQAAIDALRTWAYEPARLDGQPVAMHMKISMNFNY